MADDRLAGDAETSLDVTEFAVAVGGLIEVHEVEVDVGPRQFDVCLRVQMQQRLRERIEPGDPHLRGRERVHPGDQADDVVVRVRVEGGTADGIGVLQNRLPDDLHGNVAGRIEGAGNLLGLVGDLAEGLLAVEVLASGEEPDLVLVEGGRECRHYFSAPCGACP